MMFLTSWKLALLTCATLPFMLLQFRAFARKLYALVSAAS
jgi:ABC-type multidrug transport system fused ATPase/permease subunit